MKTKKMDIKYYFFILGIILCMPIYAQNTAKPKAAVVKGTVTDVTGAPIPGVTVAVKNDKNGTSTDENGKYQIMIPEKATILTFSFIGMVTQEVKIGEKTKIDIVLKDDSQNLDEVVIVAFGKQKKTDMIGSITTIKASDLQKISTSNLTTALAGQAAGIIAYQRGGEPGNDNADFFVRGVTTFGTQANRSPLILIDGIELTSTDLARLQKDDIDNFSVLKDATATSLYGARGANGVILVSTKQGKEGPAKISVRLENSTSAPTKDVEIADGVTFMKMNNEAVFTRDRLGIIPYSPEKIDNTISGTNKYYYPNNDWHNLLFKNYTNNLRLNMNVSGGGKAARYFVAGSYNTDNGILKTHKMNDFSNNIKLNSYTLRSNVNINLSPKTELVVRLNGAFDDYSGPLNGGSDVYKMAVQSNPVLFPDYFPVDEEHQYVNHILFGNYGDGKYLNPFAEMVKGYKNYSRSRVLAQLELNQDLSDLTQGLKFSAMMNTNRNSFFDVSRQYSPFYYQATDYDPATDQYKLIALNPDSGTENLGNPTGGEKTISSSFYLETRLLYNREFNKKNQVSGLMVFRMQDRLESDFTSLQTSLPFRNMGISGRATYSYDNRYFVEFNFGYNGSERFHESKRFGFFPSAGAGWTISNEKFWEPYKSIVNNLRLRATYGLVGNDGIGAATDRFFYLSEVNLNDSGRAASFGIDNGYSKSGVRVSRYANPDITWEIAEKANIALEMSLFNKINIAAEYFTEHRSNILMDRTAIPTTMGLQTTIKANLGEASGRGVDLSADFHHNWKNGMWITARGNFTYATNKYEVFEEPDYDEYWRSRIGKSIQQTYGYVAERLFVDDAEAQNSPKQNFGGTKVGGGDIKYTDINNDGEITEADKVAIGNPTLPEIVYGFGFSYGYKNFDVSAFFQGLTNESFWIDPQTVSPFVSTVAGRENQVLQVIADSYWSENNRDIYAFWPRLDSKLNPNNTQTSTWFMRDGTFLRLKQVEIGYNMADNLKKNLGVSTFRLYLNASNLLNFSKFKKWDVEMGGNGLAYPIQRTLNIGMNVTFN